MRILVFLVSLLVSHAYANEENASSDGDVRFFASEWPPFEYTQADGSITGYSVEILRAMFEELKLEPSIKIFPWNRSYKLAQEEVNTAVFTMARSEKREDLFKWVGPIAPREIYLWKLKDRTEIKVSSFEDAKNYMIGTVRGEAGEQQLVDMGFDLKKNLHSVDKQARNYLLLYKKRIDFIYGLEFTTIYGLKKAGYDPSKIEKSLLLNSGLEYYYGFNKNTSDDVVNRFQQALDTIKKNGKFDKIVSKYVVQ
ncbi:substrate-binding periplasmic protein [Litoribrevibacter albus]|uniref:Amino acid ABC transporter substrate-binding protein n=1 Tax=Litoribrevibacter albus TaxID=1473156 RepID=A0AA37S7Z1_9GAMM|nr:transporter substrate-binding domain-containing protein [Litoribrevibacter albus]GLQ29658.1 amino acid ABC transporter substrate-binding protein [Litoribrevibacter albus]